MTTEARDSDNSAAQIAEPIRARKILVPIDGSEFSLHAAKYAIKIAKDDNAQLMCIYVITTLTLEYATPPARENLKKEAESWLNTIKNMAKTSSVSEVKTDILMDVHSVVEAIVNYAIIEHVDLIVMGTRGRTGLKKFLIGSVANDVVRHAHCPVLLVR
jgi:nucleotide-binding universal stress UspA family protein